MADLTQCRLLHLLLFFISFLVSNHQTQVRGDSQVPCYFIFGDSLADVGNNNNRLTFAKANYLPYGVDFLEGPTGRFTNNRTIFDVITQFLGFNNFIPPFANTSMTGVMKGVNYASAAAGILDVTSRLNQGDIISMDQQLTNHLITVLSINHTNITTRTNLSKCLYTVAIGSNDYINNYFLPRIYPTSSIFTPEQFADKLVEQYTRQLKKLYFLGARKVAIFGLGLIGSAPGIVARLGVNASAVTTASQLFTNKLPGLVNELNNQLPGANFTYINITGISLTSAGLATLNATGTCCKVVDVLYTCARGLPPCPDRDQYVFFDGFHPTDVVNVAMAERAYNAALPTDSSPYDIRTLIQLSS